MSTSAVSSSSSSSSASSINSADRQQLAYELQLPASLLSTLTRASSHPLSTTTTDDEDSAETSLGFAGHVPFTRDDDELDRLSEISSTGLEELETVFETDSQMDTADEWHSMPQSGEARSTAHGDHARQSTHGLDSKVADASSYATPNHTLGSSTSLSSVAQRYAKMRHATHSSPQKSVTAASVNELAYPSSASSVLSYNLSYANAKGEAVKRSIKESILTPASLGGSWDDAGSPLQPGKSDSLRDSVEKSIQEVLHKPMLAASGASMLSTGDVATTDVADTRIETEVKPAHVSQHLTAQALSDSSIYPPSTLSISAPPTISSSLAASVAITEHTFEQRAGAFIGMGSSAGSSFEKGRDLPMLRSYRHDSELGDITSSECTQDLKAGKTRVAVAKSYVMKRWILSAVVACMLAALVSYRRMPTDNDSAGLVEPDMALSSEAIMVEAPLLVDVELEEPIAIEHKQIVLTTEDDSDANVEAEASTYSFNLLQIIKDSAAAYQAELAGFMACLVSGSVLWLLGRLLRWLVGSEKREGAPESVPRTPEPVEDKDDAMGDAGVPDEAAFIMQNTPLLRAASVRLASPAMAKKQVSFADVGSQSTLTAIATPKSKLVTKATASPKTPLSAIRSSPSVVTRAMTRAASTPVKAEEEAAESASPRPARRSMSSTHAAALAALSRGSRAVSAPPAVATEVVHTYCASPSSTSCTSTSTYESPYASRLRPRAPSASPCTAPVKAKSQPKADALHHVFVASFDDTVDMHASRLLARITGKAYPATIEEAANYRCRSHSHLFDRDGKIIELVYRYAEGSSSPSTYADWEKHNVRFVKLNDLRGRDVYICLYSACNPVRNSHRR